jgi:hypothetical protein
VLVGSKISFEEGLKASAVLKLVIQVGHELST